MSGMDRTTVAFIEDPEKNPTIYNLLRYSLALGIDLGKTLSACERSVVKSASDAGTGGKE